MSRSAPQPSADVAATIERERERGLEQLLEIIAGDRCPCGHDAGDHRASRSSGGVPAGLVRVLGPCRVCDCRGLIELDEDEQP